MTIDWAIPRFMPGDPVQALLSRCRLSRNVEGPDRLLHEVVRIRCPVWKQYLNFWAALFHGDLGREHRELPSPVCELIRGALPYTLALLVPAIVLSSGPGTRSAPLPRVGRCSITRCCPVGYVAHGDPVNVARHRARLGLRLDAGDLSGLRRVRLLDSAGLVTGVRRQLRQPLVPAVPALFLVSFGGWAIGMRNLIIYELEADYSNYLAALGAPTKLVRKYAYRNAVLPQMSGLALALGAVVGGALVVEIVFGIPVSDADPHGDPESRLLPHPGDLPAPDHRRPDRELHRRHRLRDRRSAHPGGIQG